MFRIFTTKEFDDDFNNLDESDKKRAHKIMKQLKKQGDSVGKPLRRKYFREKKFGKKRLYYLIYKEFTLILTLGIGDKKTQQETIDEIFLELDNYKEFVINKLKKL